MFFRGIVGDRGIKWIEENLFIQILAEIGLTFLLHPSGGE